MHDADIPGCGCSLVFLFLQTLSILQLKIVKIEMTTATTEFCRVASAAHAAFSLVFRRFTAVDDCITTDCMTSEHLSPYKSAGAGILTTFAAEFNSCQDEVGVCASSDAFPDSHLTVGHAMQRIRERSACGTLTKAALVCCVAQH